MASRKCPFCKGTGLEKDEHFVEWFTEGATQYSPPGKCLDCEGTGKQHKGWIAGSGSGSQGKPTGSNIRSSSGHYVVY
jgi:hypothetical protein